MVVPANRGIMSFPSARTAGRPTIIGRYGEGGPMSRIRNATASASPVLMVLAAAVLAGLCFAAEPGEGGPQPAGAPAPEAKPDFKVTRLPDNPILRPDMMPKDDGEWSGNLNFPSVI